MLRTYHAKAKSMTIKANARKTQTHLYFVERNWYWHRSSKDDREKWLVTVVSFRTSFTFVTHSFNNSYHHITATTNSKFSLCRSKWTSNKASYKTRYTYKYISMCIFRGFRLLFHNYASLHFIIICPYIYLTS